MSTPPRQRPFSASQSARSRSSSREREIEEELMDGVAAVESLEAKEAAGEKGFTSTEAPLAVLPFFDTLDPKGMRLLSRHFKRKVLKEGEVVLAEGKDADGFHVLVRGSVSLSAKKPDGKEVILATKRQSEHFGEMALVGMEGERAVVAGEHRLQPVTIRTLEPTILLSISSKDFQDFCNNHPEVRVSLAQRVGGTRFQLRNIPFFQGIPEIKLQQLAALFEFKTCKEGEVICRQGDDANGFYILVDGRVNVSASGPAGGGGVHLNTLVKGDWFGEIALIRETTRTATLTSVQPCTLLFLNAKRFATFLKLAPEVMENPLFTATITRRTANSLKAIPLFSFLQKKAVGPLTTFDDNRLSLLGELFHFVQYGPEQIVFREGDAADAFFIVVRGVLHVYSRTSSFSSSGAGSAPASPTGADAKRSFAFPPPPSSSAPATALPSTEGGNSHVLKNPRLAPRASSGAQAAVTAAAAVAAAASQHLPPAIPQLNLPRPTSAGPSLHSAMAAATAAANTTTRLGPQTARGFRTARERNASISITEFVPPEWPDHVPLATLGKNDWFGEIALLHNTRRTATVVTATPCVLLKLTSEDFKRFLLLAPELKNTFERVMSMRTAQTLKGIPFFRALKENKPFSKLDILGAMFDYEFVAAGTEVCKEGSVGDKFFVIIDGAVECVKTVYNEEKNVQETIVLETLKKDAFFGEIALIKETPRVATIRCTEDCLFLTLTKAKFQKFLQIAPDVMQQFTSLVTQRTANIVKALNFLKATLHENKPWNKLELLASMFSYEFAEKGQVILRRGERSADSSKFFVITVGAVEVSNEELGPNGRLERKVVANLQAGNFFGEVSLMKNVARTATVTTTEPSVFFTLSKAKFLQFLKLAPEARPALERMYAPSSSAAAPIPSFSPSSASSSSSSPRTPKFPSSAAAASSPSSSTTEASSASDRPLTASGVSVELAPGAAE